MKTLFRVGVLLALVAGTARAAEAAKKCREPLNPDNPSGEYQGCASNFTTSGTSDVGGAKDDKLQPLFRNLTWVISSSEAIKIEFNNFVLNGTDTPYCPGKFTVNNRPVAKDCDFTVLDGAGTVRVIFKAKSGSVGKTVKFDIVITDKATGTPRTIDPQIEIDTGNNMLPFVVVAPIVLLFFVIVTFGLIRLFRRRSGEAR
jgi:hypothetical protein